MIASLNRDFVIVSNVTLLNKCEIYCLCNNGYGSVFFAFTALRVILMPGILLVWIAYYSLKYKGDRECNVKD